MFILKTFINYVFIPGSEQINRLLPYRFLEFPSRHSSVFMNNASQELSGDRKQAL
jgi:hypothetical protein